MEAEALPKEPRRSGPVDRAPAFVRLVLAIIAATTVNIGLWIVVLILPDLQESFDVDRAGASIAYSSAMAGFAIGNLVLGGWADRFGIAPIMAACGIVLSICYAASAHAPNILVFSVLQFPIGFATAAGFAPLIADTSHWFRKYRGIAIAATACGNYLAGAVWPIILKGPIASGGWEAALLILSGSSIGLLLPLAWLLRKRISLATTEEEAGGAPIKTIPLSNKVLLILLSIAGISCCMAMATPQIHIVAYAVDLGLGAAVGAQMLSVMLAAGVVSRLISGALADRIGGVATLLIGSTLQAIGIFLYVPFNSPASLLAVTILFGLAQGGIVPSYAIIVREYLPPEVAGRRIGLVMLSTIVGMAVGGWASGFIHDLTGSYQAAFLHGVAWNLLNIAIMAFIITRSKPRKTRLVPADAG